MFEKLESIERMLQANKPEPVQPENEWLNIDELREYIPSKPARQTVYGWINRKAIPYHKNGKKVYFSRVEIDEWLRHGAKRVNDEIGKEVDQYLSGQKKRRNK